MIPTGSQWAEIEERPGEAEDPTSSPGRGMRAVEWCGDPSPGLICSDVGSTIWFHQGRLGLWLIELVETEVRAAAGPSWISSTSTR